MMRELSAAATLDLWQAAEGLGPVERSLALAAAAADAPAEEIARLPLGRRDARLLELHAALAGRVLEATAYCPACGEQAELSVDAVALLEREHAGLAAAPLEVGELVVLWRPPDSHDLAAAALAADPAAAELVLLSRCVTGVSGPDGKLVGSASLPAEARAALARAMADADPLAEVLVDLACPACETTFVADLDLGSFVWAELRARAQRLFLDVDALARSYGWTEAEVLALDERRRQAYLELAREEMR